MGNQLKRSVRNTAIKFAMRNQYFKLRGSVVVVCRNSEGKWLAVKHKETKTWQLIDGVVVPPESHLQTATRVTFEKTGIDIELKGILRIEYSITKGPIEHVKIVFYAEPESKNQIPNLEVNDYGYESQWISTSKVTELLAQKSENQEMLQWIPYLENGGTIYPLLLLANESTKRVPISSKDVIKLNKELNPTKKYSDPQQLLEFLIALKENDDSWFFSQEAKFKSDALADEQGNSLLAIALKEKHPEFIKMLLLISTESLFSMNSQGKNILMISMENYFDEQILLNLLKTIKKRAEPEQIKALLVHEDNTGLDMLNQAMEEEFPIETRYSREVYESRQLIKEHVLRNALEMRRKNRYDALDSKRKNFLENNIDYFLKTSIDAFIEELKNQRAADSPQESLDDLIAYSIKMLQEEDLREDFDALELELEQFEQEEREFADYCAEISGL